MTNNIARDGTPKALTEAPVNPGMRHTDDDGNRIAGISRTASQAALKGYSDPTAAPAEKNPTNAPAPTHPAQHPNRKDRGHVTDGLAAAVFDQAIRK